MKAYVKPFDTLTAHELYACLKLRSDVFVVEQQCVYPDLDDLDQASLHVWLEEDDATIAYARVLPPGLAEPTVAIGRVVTKLRGRGYGEKIMQAAMHVAVTQYNAEAITIEAQVQAQAFYEKLGFQPEDDVFDMDGIPHLKMIWRG